MKKPRNKNGQTGRWISTGMTFALVLALLPAVKVIWNQFGTQLDALTQQAAVFSAALAMPEGSLYLLEQQFAGDLLPPQEPSSSSSLPTPPSSSAPSSSSSSFQASSSQPPPQVDPQYRGTIIEEDLSGRNGGVYLSIGEGLLRNYTDLTDEEILTILDQPMTQTLGDNQQPQILLVHTHATESYEPYDRDEFDTRGTWRTTDDTQNMVAVGNVLAQVLEEEGFSVLHDTTQHDYPSYNGAYERSAQTIQSYLDQYPSIKVVLDIHRDAIGTTTQITKPVVEIDGKKAAQLMVAVSCDYTGSLGVENWRDNFRFGAALTIAVAQDYPGLCRPIFFAQRKYNMDLTTGSLLLEFGSHANTLEEACYTASLAGKSLARVLREWM